MYHLWTRYESQKVQRSCVPLNWEAALNPEVKAKGVQLVDWIVDWTLDWIVDWTLDWIVD